MQKVGLQAWSCTLRDSLARFWHSVWLPMGTICSICSRQWAKKNEEIPVTIFGGHEVPIELPGTGVFVIFFECISLIAADDHPWLLKLWSVNPESLLWHWVPERWYHNCIGGITCVLYSPIITYPSRRRNWIFALCDHCSSLGPSLAIFMSCAQ